VSGYVALLPPAGSFQTPLHWSEAQLEALRYPPLQASVKRQRTAWGGLHAGKPLILTMLF
jgi:hypothetical protein